MAWIFNCRSSGCSGVYQQIMPQAKLLDALKTFNKAHDIMTADILQWSEVPYKEAREFVRSQGLHKMSTTYKWAK